MSFYNDNRGCHHGILTQGWSWRVSADPSWPSLDHRLRYHARRTVNDVLEGWGPLLNNVSDEDVRNHLEPALTWQAPDVHWVDATTSYKARRKKSPTGGQLWRAKAVIPIGRASILNCGDIRPTGDLIAEFANDMLTVMIDTPGDAVDVAIEAMDVWQRKFRYYIWSIHRDHKVYHVELPSLIANIVDQHRKHLRITGRRFP